MKEQLYRYFITSICFHHPPRQTLMTVGLSLLTVLQALINMAVAVGLFPVTGLTLPFVSMGGTSLLFTGITVGSIISISRGEIDKLRSKNKKINKLKTEV